MKFSYSSPTVIALMGVPGAGKTSLARWLVERFTSLRIVSRDLIREAMFVPCFFTSEEKRAAFEAVKQAIPVIVSRGNSVVIDGMCFSEEGVLEQVEQIAKTAGARFVAIFCDCDLDIAVARVERDRTAQSHSAQDRDAELVRRIAMDFRPLPRFVIKIDSSVALEKAGEKILAYLDLDATQS